MPRDGLNELGILRRVAKGFPQSLDGVVESLLKIYESVGRPDLPSQRLTAHNFTGVFQQNLQNLKWLLLKLDPQSLLPQFYGFDVCFKVPEADRIARRMSPIYHVATPNL